MRKLNFILLITILIFTSCNNKKETEIRYKVNTENLKKEIEIKIPSDQKLRTNSKSVLKKMSNIKIDSLIKIIDEQLNKKELVKYFYPNMSFCGGGLYGFYKNTELKLIDATYSAELGFSSKKIYWNKNRIIKIVYREHFAEWGKYEKNYPSEKYKYDPKKMTYTDTIYKITFGNKTIFEKMSNGKIISTELNQELIKRLSDCGYSMKKELEAEKIKEKSR